jgi:hypothetical protein
MAATLTGTNAFVPRTEPSTDETLNSSSVNNVEKI